MSVEQLRAKKCVPCEGGVEPLSEEQAKVFLEQVSGWTLHGKRIRKELVFGSFLKAIRFINLVAEIAEQEGHHPDIHLYYKNLTLEIWTHAIGGLSENDFILAAKTDNISLD